MNPAILLVEDDAVLRSGLTELFAREGYRVIEAASVREANEKRKNAVQAIVLDVGLPDGDGISLCREWRAAGEQRPILFLTAKDEELDVVRALDSGGNDYVTKPFRMQELLSRVRVLLRDTAKPQAIRRGSFTRSFRGPAVNAVRRSPSTRTRVARSLTRSRLIAVTGIAATAFTTATPDSRLVRTR